MNPNDHLMRLIPETAWGGFVYETVTPIGADPTTGSGFLHGPDGSRARIHWEVAENAYISLIERPGQEHWGTYRLGFTQSVQTTADLVENLGRHRIRLGILYKRARVN